MSSNLVKDPHASSSRTERNETPITLEDETPLTNPQKETSSVVDAEREPFYKESKLFRVNIGSKNAPQYLYLSHDLVKKDKSDAQENKRQIYDGFFNCDVPVAILKIEPILSGTTRKELERERRLLTELEVHENFIRYIAHEWDKDFEYIATERCLCSVADLLDQDLIKEVQMNKEILEELGAKEILRQATRGLDYLHQNNFVHRNLKPNNFLIKEINQTGYSSHRFVAKITDFRLTRKRDSFEKLLTGAAASQGWEAPESRNVEKVLSTKLDVFILGCFYHYVLISLSKKEDSKKKPRHPFGDK
ncbi:serine/threonine-protein kinase/endoribonuclease ire-1-like [Daphnia magna]|uniref:serine/threonine-protein kinase/endoribonuclease ire-1-like n=1 Tax=Daphnia magna TaxID=35525 RepID=UPI001E1BB7F9|nr:serine/threonine-protein kinase/endoribonuclease ire-1-like [Daphnia magna]